MRRIALIMAGGKGTRLHPLSTEDNPKQFLPLFSDKSMLGETIDRLDGLFCWKDIVINSVESYREKIEKISKVRKTNQLIEPMRKGTMLSVMLACWKWKDCVIALIPSDHYISKVEKYQEALKKAMDIAELEDKIVTIGIEPTYPEIDYGYIKHQGKAVMEFVEKPSRLRASLYVSMGYKWNSGIFVFKASTMIEEYQSIHPFFTDLFESFMRDGEIEKAYRNLQSMTIEKSIIERSNKIAVVPASFEWSDVGTVERLKKVWGMMYGEETKANP